MKFSKCILLPTFLISSISSTITISSCSNKSSNIWAMVDKINEYAINFQKSTFEYLPSQVKITIVETINGEKTSDFVNVTPKEIVYTTFVDEDGNKYRTCDAQIDETHSNGMLAITRPIPPVPEDIKKQIDEQFKHINLKWWVDKSNGDLIWTENGKIYLDDGTEGTIEYALGSINKYGYVNYIKVKQIAKQNGLTTTVVLDMENNYLVEPK